MRNLFFLHDGTAEEKIEGRVRRLLEEQDLFVESGHKGFRVLGYCGFVFSDDFVAVSLPKTMSTPLADEVEVCKTLYRALLKYFREVTSARHQLSIASAEILGDLDSLGVFHAYNELLEDWSRYGVYKNRIKQERVSPSGRVNWKKTFRRLTPCYDENGAPVYSAFCTERRDLRLEEIVSDIHRWCVSNADFSIGWMKSTDSKLLLFPEISHWRNHAPCGKEKAVAFLKKELRKQYEQRKIRILKLMVHILERADARNKIDVKAFGVRLFWPVWEAICRVLVGDESLIHSASLPRPKYLNNLGGVMRCSSGIGQRPDIVVQGKGGSLAVVDAKYYDVRVNVPGWQDIVKQYFYASSFDAVGYSESVTNAFLFPLPDGAKPLPAKVEMEVPSEIIAAGTLRNEFFGRMFKPVQCQYFDMQQALIGYVESKIETDLREVFLRGR